MLDASTIFLRSVNWLNDTAQMDSTSSPHGLVRLTAIHRVARTVSISNWAIHLVECLHFSHKHSISANISKHSILATLYMHAILLIRGACLLTGRITSATNETRSCSAVIFEIAERPPHSATPSDLASDFLYNTVQFRMKWLISSKIIVMLI